MKEVEFERKVKEKDAEIEMKKAELDRQAKEKDAELERQAKIIQEIQINAELVRQTTEIEKNKRIDLLENKMDLIETKINKMLDLMNKS